MDESIESSEARETPVATPAAPNQQLVVADRLAKAIVYLGGGMVVLFAVLYFVTWRPGSPLAVGGPGRLATLAMCLEMMLLLIVTPLAFRRRKSWAWDVTIAMLCGLLVAAPVGIISAVVKPNPEMSNSAFVPVVILASLLTLYIARLLLRPEVRAEFPTSPPSMPFPIRIVAGWMAASACGNLADLAGEPKVIVLLPTVAYAIAAYALYTRRKDAPVAALAALALAIFHSAQLPTPNWEAVGISIAAAMGGAMLIFRPPAQLH